MDNQLVFNGIHESNSAYLLSPIEVDLFARLVASDSWDPAEVQERSAWLAMLRSGKYGVLTGHDPMRLDESGWGVVFPSDGDPAIVSALRPLLDWRKQQAGPLYHEYGGADGVQPGDRKKTWLARPPRGAGPGPVDPQKVPYYLLLVGTPEQIPFSFQTQLDVQYAVGRVCFSTAAEYARYARSVVEAEQQQRRLARSAAFFATAHPDDPATQRSKTELVEPLADWFESEHLYAQPPWTVTRAFEREATRDRLAQLLNGAQPPALLFSATHGIGLNSGSQQQFARQGALLCQDWPGPTAWRGRPVLPEFTFAASDITPSAGLWGTIVFLFACYSAGTPQWDDFLGQTPLGGGEPQYPVAPRPFVAALPQRMLAHPNGGALAVIGHVDRAWGFSFYWGSAGRQSAVFRGALRRLLEGYPVGYALEAFNERYAEISTDLDELRQLARGSPLRYRHELAELWTANSDAKNYVILGDPAVRLSASLS